MWRDYLPAWFAGTSTTESSGASGVVLPAEGARVGDPCCGEGIAAALPAEQIAPCATLQPRATGRRIEKLGERVYCAVGYALSNVTMIAVEGGKIIVDATESCQAGR